MKKIGSLLLTAAMLLGIFSACGQEAASSALAASSTASQ